MNKSVPAAFDDLNKALAMYQKLAANRGPFFTWMMIGTCIEHKKQFPDWVINYLAQCAERMCNGRMQSERAKRTDDVGKMFLWIFGFPKKKPGPGGLLDPDDELLKEAQKGAFALNFIIRLWQGEDPVQARGNAGNEFFPAKDDKTLQRYLREQLRLKKLPRTIDEWAPEITPTTLLRIATKVRELFG
jgi:hypothetical protein